jgi:hypothetical protein
VPTFRTESTTSQAPEQSPSVDQQTQLEKTHAEAELKKLYEQMWRDTLALRQRILTKFPSVAAATVAARIGAPVSPADLAIWLKERRIFSFQQDDLELFPLFQFEDGLPSRPLWEVLESLEAEKPDSECGPPLRGWDAMYWFASANAWLDGRSPVEVLDSEPAAVVLAAKHARDRYE